MKTEYAVEVYNKYHDTFVEQIDVFNTYEDAKRYIRETNIPIDENNGEYLEITEIEYDDDDDEVGIRTGLVV